jgi:glutamyl-tRNA synthetase
MKFFGLFSKQVKTRFAPSPTGPLHLGGARTALFNYLFAAQNRGRFVLRMEDTDKKRSDKRFEKDIIHGLKWLGLNYDEFYRQSERTKIYEKYLKKLLDQKRAFWCFHNKEELAEEKKIQMANKEAPRHRCVYKNKGDAPMNKKGVIRLKESEKKIKFTDLIRGEVEYDGTLLGDIAIAKDQKTPLYNFAVVIDDYEMKISHVIRGEDHLPNTPKQILIQEALGIERPHYAHIPLILNSGRHKLSKREGAVSINEYKRVGYLSEALVNFLALLGWSAQGPSGQNEKEMLSMKDLIQAFSLNKVQKGGAVFNINKLTWFNKEYIRKMPADKLSKELIQYIPEKWRAVAEQKKYYWQKIVELEKPRLSVLSEIRESAEFFFTQPNYPKSLLNWKNQSPDKTCKHLDKLLQLLSNLKAEEFTEENIKTAVWPYAEEQGRGNVLWPFRVALTGQAKSPDPFSVATILGKEETLERLKYAKNL